MCSIVSCSLPAPPRPARRYVACSHCECRSRIRLALERSKDIGRRRRASRNGTGKAGAIGSVSGAGSAQRNKPFRRLRGSSLKNFFSCSCDRPGCYVEFDRTRRSPLQRFCSPECRHAFERVRERERRWRNRGAGPSAARRAPQPGRNRCGGKANGRGNPISLKY